MTQDFSSKPKKRLAFHFLEIFSSILSRISPQKIILPLQSQLSL